MSNWLKFLLTWPSSIVANTLHTHTLLEDPGTWQAWRQTKSVKTGRKRYWVHQPQSIKSILCHQIACTVVNPCCCCKPFSLTLLFLPVNLKKPFCIFHTSFNSSWALALLTVPAHLGCVSVSLLASPSSLPLLCTFSSVFELSQEFLGHLWWPSIMPALISAHQKGLFYFEKAVFQDKAACLGPFGRPGQSLLRSCQDVPWINQNMLS